MRTRTFIVRFSFGGSLRPLDPSIYLGNVETGKSKKKSLVTAEGDHRSEGSSQGRPFGSLAGEEVATRNQATLEQVLTHSKQQ